MFKDIQKMYEYYGIPMAAEPTMLSREDFDFRFKFLHEELAELDSAEEQQNFPEVIDALVDLVVVALGTAAMMGIDWDKHWQEVLRANMAKVVGKGKRGYANDLVKPDGWQEPDHAKIIGWTQLPLPLEEPS